MINSLGCDDGVTVNIKIDHHEKTSDSSQFDYKKWLIICGFVILTSVIILGFIFAFLNKESKNPDNNKPLPPPSPPQPSPPAPTPPTEKPTPPQRPTETPTEPEPNCKGKSTCGSGGIDV